MNRIDRASAIARLASEPVRATVEFAAVVARDSDEDETDARLFEPRQADCHGGSVRNGPSNVWLYASTAGHAFTSLALRAGTGMGRDRLSRVWKALAELRLNMRQSPGVNELVIWLLEARRLSPCEQEEVAMMLGYCAQHLGLRLRLVYILGPVARYDGKQHSYVRAQPVTSGRVLRSGSSVVRSRAAVEAVEEDEGVEERTIIAA